MNNRQPERVSIAPWSEQDLPLLEKLLGDADMMKHLGGPETVEQIQKRHQRYLQLPDTDHMFKILVDDEAAGSIGYWEKTWRDGLVYEMGWHVLASHQGRGIATKAGKTLLQHARQEHRHQFMHAFPSIENAASNAICRKLGFALLGECDFEYPPGNLLRCNDWRFDLFAVE
jgi:RimJ/RimL family protein N-acetyltransferase